MGLNKKRLILLGAVILFIAVSISLINFKGEGAGKKSSAIQAGVTSGHTIPLIYTKWGQDAGYATFSPGNNLVGCWSTALAQILYFHRMEPHGSVEYTTSTGYKIDEELESFKFDWSKFTNAIRPETTDEAVEQVSRYLYYVSAVIQKNFGANNYNIQPELMVKEIMEHFDCKAAWYGADYSNDRKKEIISGELDEGRPVMMYIEGTGNGHAFVVDAYKIVDGVFRIHINMGYAGKSNGWYDFEERILNFDDRNERDIMTVIPVSK